MQAAWAAQRCSDEQRLNPAARLAAVTLARDCCGRRLEAVAEGDPEDTPGDRSDAPRLERLVADVRARERRILERAKFLLTQERTQLRCLASA